MSRVAVCHADTAHLESLLAELDERNADNVARTESYLELYAWTRAHPPDLPWLLMAHLVSRNAGYLMTEAAQILQSGGRGLSPGALRETFLFLERANYLIFFDAWYHVLHHLLGRSGEIAQGRCSRFVREAWSRYERAQAASGAGAAASAGGASLERGLVEDLVTNEQRFIDRRVVHHPRFGVARALIAFAEAAGHDQPVVLPCTEASFRVGGFAVLSRRIATGMRIFDGAMADRSLRDAMYAWAMRHPHDGSRAPLGGAGEPRLRDVWPVGAVRSLWSGVHAPPEADPEWP
jgi:hypothetical protein